MKVKELMKLCSLIREYRELAIDTDVRPSDRLDKYSYFNRHIRELDKQAEALGITDLKPVEVKEGMR